VFTRFACAYIYVKHVFMFEKLRDICVAYIYMYTYTCTHDFSCICKHNCCRIRIYIYTLMFIYVYTLMFYTCIHSHVHGLILHQHCMCIFYVCIHCYVCILYTFSRPSYVHICIRSHVLYLYTLSCSLDYYGVASISRLLKIIGLFCKRAL